MMARQHLEFAAITSVTAAYYLTGTNIEVFDYPLLFMGTALLGSLVPDIDSPNSAIGSSLPHLSLWINRKFEHRTVTHDLLLWTIVAVICSIIFPLSLGFWYGYLGHLLIDAFTTSGICWGYFFHKKYFKVWRYNMKNMDLRDGVIHLLPRDFRVRSNGFGAKVLTIVLALGVSYLYYYHNGGLSILEIITILRG